MESFIYKCHDVVIVRICIRVRTVVIVAVTTVMIASSTISNKDVTAQVGGEDNIGSNP